jgi:ATP-dependent Clp protease ATP-binding subunit ClpB
LAEKRVQLAVTPAARAWLAEAGYDPIYGARPLRRLMQQQIDDQLANLILAGTIHDGSLVKVDYDGNSKGLSVTATELAAS